jgi:5-methylcytosine-specific restriction enzyme B
MLSDESIKALYEEEAFQGTKWAEWRKNYEATIARIASLSDQELARPEVQEELWSARALTSVGPGDGVRVTEVLTDQAIIDAIIAVRRRVWSSDAKTRSQEIQAEFDRLLELVADRVPRKPSAKLWRMFAVLLPAHMHCVFSWHPCRQVMWQVLENPRGLYGVEGHVLVRDRLRRILGEEADLTEHVKRATFCWYLYERSTQKTSTTAAPTANTPPQPLEETTPLVVWQFHKQNKGLGSPQRNVESYRDVVRATLDGARQDEVVELLAAEPNFDKRPPEYLRALIYAVKKLGLIELRDGQLFPTEDGEEFLLSQEPDPLVRRMIERIFPFAHLLRLFATQDLSRQQAALKLQEIYPSWTTTMQPFQLLMWAQGLGLIEQLGSKLSLTEYGRNWVQRLPKDLPTVPKTERGLIPEPPPEEPPEPPAPTEPPKKWPGLAELLQAFESAPSVQSFVFDRRQLIALHNALHCAGRKRFAILSGLSGTGKTQLMKKYAELFCGAVGVDAAQHCQIVAVSPDWRDPTGLLGYVNELRNDPSYLPGPALGLILAAQAHPERPYFLLLDEMNLARVELYFAPLLSAMETGGALVLHTRKSSVDEVPASIQWPANLFIIGSVNMDETTHPFSDKVLDRAFTLEFSEVDLPRFFEKRTTRDMEAEQLLVQLHALLKPVRRHFGYRTADEFLSFLLLPGGADDKEMRQQLIDQAVFSKILPRVRGEDTPTFRKALEDLKKLCQDNGLSRSSQKATDMIEMLGRSGVTRFWS